MQLHESERYRLSWFAPKKKLAKLQENWAQEIEGDAMNGFFELLLSALSLLMIVAPFWRKSIKGFRGRYMFLSVDGDIHTSVEYVHSWIFGTRMKVGSGTIEAPDVTLQFKNGQSLYAFLLSGGSDIFSAILDNKLSFSGNINYLLKFAYLSQHVLHMFRPD